MHNHFCLVLIILHPNYFISPTTHSDIILIYSRDRFLKTSLILAVQITLGYKLAFTLDHYSIELHITPRWIPFLCEIVFFLNYHIVEVRELTCSQVSQTLQQKNKLTTKMKLVICTKKSFCKILQFTSHKGVIEVRPYLCLSKLPFSPRNASKMCKVHRFRNL